MFHNVVIAIVWYGYGHYATDCKEPVILSTPILSLDTQRNLHASLSAL
jgi:hypothetical protein